MFVSGVRATGVLLLFLPSSWSSVVFNPMLYAVSMSVWGIVSQVFSVVAGALWQPQVLPLLLAHGSMTWQRMHVWMMHVPASKHTCIIHMCSVVTALRFVSTAGVHLQVLYCAHASMWFSQHDVLCCLSMCNFTSLETLACGQGVTVSDT